MLQIIFKPCLIIHLYLLIFFLNPKLIIRYVACKYVWKPDRNLKFEVVLLLTNHRVFSRMLTQRMCSTELQRPHLDAIRVS